jgi:hypothetical protein
MNPLTRQQLKFLDAAETIHFDPDKTESAFIARQLVQATLPHKDPGNIPLWSRRNGNLTLTIQPGQKQGGLDSHSRGKRSDAKRLREQMERLFRATISFEQMRKEAGRTGEMWRDMKVAPEGMLWWDEKRPEQGALWYSWIELSKQFFEAITAAPVPVDMRALNALKRSPLALDLYAWATYTAFQTQKRGQSRFVSWELLHEQMGAEYSTVKNFSQKARGALRKVQAVYPALGLEFEPGGVKVLPCNPAVTIKPRAVK